MNLPISIRGARQHNLRNLDLDLPSNKLIVFCGPSGSGKSSLAFDTLFSESRRRFLDCLSARSRQGMDQPEKPEVDSITGLPPALCLEQSARQQSSRTLLGSITEILDYLRIHYAASATGSGMSWLLATSIQLGVDSGFLLPLGAGTVVNDPNMALKRGGER